jgi:mevalonate kinase
MPAITARAPGKAILFGEHSVVYARPAIAIPVTQVQAKATILADLKAPTGRVWIDAPDIDLNCDLTTLNPDHPLAQLLRIVQETLKIDHFPALRMRLTSTIPVAAGLGSGAAVSVAAIRALSNFCGLPLDNETVSQLAYQIEKIYHGTPSGIDNTVITFAQPIYFIRGQPIELLKPAFPFTLVIADTGIASLTAAAVGGVRLRWQETPTLYEALFDCIARITQQARQYITTGNVPALGPLMYENHQALVEMGVSSPELDRLVRAAQTAGAWGAKLSGGGQGGNMIALAPVGQAEHIAAALRSAGAVQTIVSEVK